MNHFFRAEHEQFRQRVRLFVERELRPHSTSWERAGEFPRSVLQECARHELFQSDPWSNAILAEELPRCESLGFALSFFVQANLITPLFEEFGTIEQKSTYIPALRSGRMMGAMAVTEPDAGSDFSALQCRAELSGDDLVLHGEKTYITNAAFADFLITAVRIPALSEDGLTLVLVPSNIAGVTVERLQTLGLCASGTARVSLDGCRVNKDQVLGAVGQGFGQVQRALNRERLFGGIACVSWADYAMRKTLLFARQRKAFGKHHQSLSGHPP
jgi:alkylation response protein AidB-like acyl-CoA dehydrogenase